MDSPPQQFLLQQLRHLEARIEALQDAPADDLPLAASRHRQLEEELLKLSADVLYREPETGVMHGHPVLAEVGRWCDASQSLGLDDVRCVCKELTDHCMLDEVQSWEQQLEARINDPAADNFFDDLLHTTTLELELAAHQSSSQVETRLQDLRVRLRNAFAEALATSPPEDDLLQRWCEELIDRSELMLTAIDDATHPLQAAAQLNEVIDDLQWHLAQVETSRGSRRWLLKRKLARLKAEAQERRLQATLESKFGSRNVARFERLILLLIFAVLGLLIAEQFYPRPPLWMVLTDTAICGVFLFEFFGKLALVSDRWRWFRRHFLIDLVPSLPFLLLMDSIEILRAGRLARFIRFGRLARYARWLRPFIRMFRAFGFLTRGLDRIVRQYGGLLNRSVILYPTREERTHAAAVSRSLMPRVRHLRNRLHRSWMRLLKEAPEEHQTMIARARLEGVQAARDGGLTMRPPRPRKLVASGTREVPAETLLRRLSSLTAQDVEASLSEDLITRLARAVRILARAPVCWLPVIRSLVPRITRTMSEARIVAAASHALSARLKRQFDRWQWLADLYGTVTPSQFIDRIGLLLVRSSVRPAYKLALFGGAFLLVRLSLLIARSDMLHSLQRNYLDKIVGVPLMLLGGVCLCVLGVGWWLRRMAREATEFYERAAQAQFLPLTEIIRSRNLRRDSELVYDRVLGAEWRLRHGEEALRLRAEHVQRFRRRLEQSLIGASFDTMEDEQGFEVLERVVFLFRDSLDGAMFADSDNRTTSQLLGNPAIQQSLQLSRRVSKRERKSLDLLDLERQKSLLGGPYLWFNFISRAMAHSVACLLVDYNRHAIPLSELPLVSERERRRFETWLESEDETGGEMVTEEVAVKCVTTAFTALHFLDNDPQRDRDVQTRFGPQLLTRLRRDRSLMVRRVFGTFPLHELPKERRILNLHELYLKYLGGGRALLLPVFLLWRWLKFLGSLVKWLWHAIGEVRHLERRADYRKAATADFSAAERKIQRMRGPLVQFATRLLAKIDPHYLGVAIPGYDDNPAAAQVDDDLEFMDAEPALVRKLNSSRHRAQADMRRLAKLIHGGLLERVAQRIGLPADALSTPEHVRAAATCYLGDYRGVRELLTSSEVLDETWRASVLEHLVAPRPWPRPKLKRMFNRYWNEYTRRHAVHDPKSERRAAWRATIYNRNGCLYALRDWCRWGEECTARGEKVLGELLRHPGRITEQLVTLRTVQTLALLDILEYREHVFHLGGYAQLGDTLERAQEITTPPQPPAETQPTPPIERAPL